MKASASGNISLVGHAHLRQVIFGVVSICFLPVFAAAVYGQALGAQQSTVQNPVRPPNAGSVDIRTQYPGTPTITNVGVGNGTLTIIRNPTDGTPVRPLLRSGSGSVDPNDDRLVLEGSGFDWMGGASWMIWWEAHRWDYLLPAASEPGKRGKLPPTTRPAAPPAPASVIAALQRGVRSMDPRVRGESVLALGLIQHDASLETLKLLLKDADNAVRLRAWAAIGLLGTAQSKTLLETQPANDTELNKTGWALAVGLMQSEPSAQIWTAMRRLIQDEKMPAAQLRAAWAIRMHQPSFQRDVLRQAFLTTANPSLFCEAMFGLADCNDPEDAVLVSQLLSPDNQTLALPIAHDQMDPRQRITSLSQAAIMALAGFEPLPDQGYGRIVDSAPPVPGQVGILQSGTVGAFDLSKGVGASRCIALGMIANPRDIQMLQRTLDFAQPDQGLIMNPLEFRHNSQRGYAAIGIGLYMRKHGGADLRGQTIPETGGTVPPVADSLDAIYKQSTELTEIRSACAMALGLTGDSQRYARTLKEAFFQFNQGDEPTAAYASLALGMLGDPAALTTAQQALGPAVKKLDIQKIVRSRPGPRAGTATGRVGTGRVAAQAKLTNLPMRELIWRRAMVQAVGALHESQSIPLLMGEWGKNYALSYDVARAIAMCRGTPQVISPGRPAVDPAGDFADSLSSLMNQEAVPSQLQAEAAASLGVLYANGTSLARLDHVLGDLSGVLYQRVLTQGPVLPAGAVYEADIGSMCNPFYLILAEASGIGRPR